MTGWQAHTVVTEEYVDPAPVAALSAVLDSGAPPLGVGDPLPPLWHWAALARWPVSSSIGADGHPARGTFLPPVDLPRRMFAGGDVVLHEAVAIGSTVRREARVVAVTPKNGRTGPLVVVDVEIRLYTAADTLAVVERQNLIYREAAQRGADVATPPAPEAAGTPLRRVAEWDWELRTDPTVLMRFSAATANSHRIHYDWPYATGVEGYPGLVVHGPLMTLAMAETLRRERPESMPTRLRHRNLAPLFCAEPARIQRRDTTGIELAVRTGDGTDRTVEHTVLTASFDHDGDRTHA
ncbi:MaoC family dehydratase N-terminal domain-containing protein [Nocardia alba]|uniref:3-methylfumaryl-CoA hydratase n=1 Tax=Nocardia alba TaxID=225051 RepID=A0A4R1FXS1_9NOCA|nr:MaoC family dehydratase N-terminal domain-containing protein [Nocardia alba]TCJ97618.1 3-methylfumaryl-CoA hydratase [Nocardia alba]